MESPYEEQKDNTFREDSIIKLAYGNPFPPFAVSKKGRPEGLAIAILRESFGKVHLRVVFIPGTMDKIQDLLFDGKTHGLAFMGINSKRKKTYDFSDPYIITSGSLFVKSPNQPSPFLKEFEGKTVVTPKKGPLAGYIQEKFPTVNLISTAKDYPGAMKMVLDGKADAAALNTQVGAYLANQLFPGAFTLPQKSFLEIPIGAAVLKGKHALFLKQLNGGLRDIMISGTYDKIMRKWNMPVGAKPSNH